MESADTTLSCPDISAIKQAISQQIKPSANLLIIGTFFPALLVPIAAVLFFFSTPKQRRQPIFILNAIALGVGLAEGGFIIYNVTAGIIGIALAPGLSIALATLTFLVPMVQTILLFRVVTVYPPSKLSWRRRILIYAPFVVLKTGRLINGVIFLAVLYKRTDSSNPLTAGVVSWTLPEIKIEWFLQLSDNTYASMLFLLRLKQGRVLSTRQEFISSTATTSRRVSYTERLKALFWIAAFNFVFPVMFNIVQLVIIFRDPNFFHGSYVIWTNDYLEIIGVLLSTIWISGRNVGTQRTHSALPVAFPGSTSSAGELALSSMVSPCMELSEGLEVKGERDDSRKGMV